MTERRKHRRFNLRCPVHGTFSCGNSTSDFDAVSRNVSIGGLLMETASEIPLHSLVSFTTTVQDDMVVHPIVLGGEGGVVRLEPAEAGVWSAIAVACTQPIAQLGGNVSGTVI
jgi:hypothetical protein